MNSMVQLVRPATLEVSAEYLWREDRADTAQEEFRPVRFVCYDPCPAFIIVLSENGEKMRCLRDDLYVRAS